MAQLTHALELLFQFSHMLAVGDAEVVIRIVSLVDTVGWSGRADGQNRGWTLSSLGLSDFPH